MTSKRDLKPLREELKRAYEAWRSHFVGERIISIGEQIIQGTTTQWAQQRILELYGTTNMREAWNLSRIYQMAVWHGWRDKAQSDIHDIEVSLFEAGVAYYGAKSPKFARKIQADKHSAMMNRLTRDD